MLRWTSAGGFFLLTGALCACVGDSPAPTDAGSDATPPVDAAGDVGTSDAAADGGASTIASAQKQPQAIAVVGAYVYWINTAGGSPGQGAVVRCPTTGCSGPPQEIQGALTAPLALAVDTTSVYFSAGTTGSVSVTQCGLGSCTSPVQLATAEAEVPALALAEGKLFYARRASSPNGGAYQCTPGAAGSCIYILTGLNAVDGLAVIPTHFFYAELVNAGGVVQAFRRSDNFVSTLASSQVSPRALRVSGSYLYWLNPGAVQRAAAGDFTGPAQQVAPAGNPGDLAVDGTDVYFTNRDDGTVAKCPVTGCATPTVLATGQASPEGIAVDATSVYWTVKGAGASDGAVMRLAK